HRHPPDVIVIAYEIARAHEVFVGVIALPHFLDGKVEDRRIEALAARSSPRPPHSAPTRPDKRGGQRVARGQRELSPDVIEPSADRAERLRVSGTGDTEADGVGVE